ncbi:MAG: RDD family protein [Acidimicrobiales bacterium]
MELEDTYIVPGAEGLDLHLVLAGLGSRSVAFAIDLLIEAVALFLMALVAGTFGDIGAAGAAIGVFMVLFGYPILAEAFAGGRTLGKAAMGLRVVADDGTPVGFLAAVIRNIVRVVDALPGTYTVGMISILASKRNQRVGDMAASTLVIRSRAAPVAVPSAGWSPAAAIPAPGVPAAPGYAPMAGGGDHLRWDVSAVTADEVAAIREFLGRRWSLDQTARWSIADALARQVAPKVAGVPFDGGPEPFLERVVQAKLAR